MAIRLARACNGVVINADASQVYADLRILSARPTEEEMAAAPHRLFGHVDGAEACSAARWAGEARAEIDAAHRQGLLPVLVGGTGLYLDTLLHGIAPVPDIEPEIRAAIRAMPVAESHAALEREDPEAAARLKPGDTARVARALEVVRSTGTPLGQWQRRRVGGIAGAMAIHAGVVLPAREDLARRAEQRLAAMMAGGAMEEVAALLARKLPPDRPVLRALGVRELGAVLSGELSLAEAQAAILKVTLAYQKRQLTWARGRQAGWTRIDPSADLYLERLPPLA